MTPEASSIPEQPKEAAKSAVSALKEATSSQPQAAGQDAAAAAKDLLPEAPKELPNPFQGFFSGLEMPPFMQRASSPCRVFGVLRAGEPCGCTLPCGSSSHLSPDCTEVVWTTTMHGCARDWINSTARLQAGSLWHPRRDIGSHLTRCSKSKVWSTHGEGGSQARPWQQGHSQGCAAAGGSKPELPQQEPAVGPGQKVDIPESKDEAPLPKVDAPNPLGGLFGGKPC